MLIRYDIVTYLSTILNVFCNAMIFSLTVLIFIAFLWAAQEEEKQVLVGQTGLELKQINNWFINQRKRNWHNNSTIQMYKSTSAKRKSNQ